MMTKKSMPTLIFSEIHSDPITFKILTKLVPELKFLGYRYFFDEVTPTRGLQHAIKVNRENIEGYYEVKEFYDSFGLDMTITADILEMLKNAKKAEYQYLLFNLMLSHLSRAPFADFLQELRDKKIHYVGIDVDRVDPLTQDDFIKYMHKYTEENMVTIRDKTLGQAYLQTIFSVFGRIGFDHVKGVQEEILKHLSLLEASANFLFFYIYSDYQVPPLITRDDLRRKKREVVFPLGMIRINATKKTEDEIVNFILEQVRERQDYLEKINKERNLAITNIFTCEQNTEWHRFFQFAVRLKCKSIEVLSNDELEVDRCRTTPY